MENITATEVEYVWRDKEFEAWKQNYPLPGDALLEETVDIVLEMAKTAIDTPDKKWFKLEENSSQI